MQTTFLLFFYIIFILRKHTSTPLDLTCPNTHLPPPSHHEHEDPLTFNYIYIQNNYKLCFIFCAIAIILDRNERIINKQKVSEVFERRLFRCYVVVYDVVDMVVARAWLPLDRLHKTFRFAKTTPLR